MTNNSVSVNLCEGVIRRPSSFLFQFFDTLTNLSHIKKGIIWGWYQYLSKLDGAADWTFMNYGYAPLDQRELELELRPEDQQNRYCIQLYQRVAGAVELCGKSLLEVGCGRGGGASFIARYHQPHSLTAVDFSSRAVAFCKGHYHDEGLSFLHADAERLPLPADSFDAVINVESSHCYNSMDRFLREVRRVLRPGGHFLFADIRLYEAAPLLRKQLSCAGLRLLEEERMNTNVLKALELDNERKLTLIRNTAPRFMQERLQQFAGLMGSPVHRRFLTDEWEYLRFTLEKV
jgi:ubiquinone/menaquinone biosynthesis C-methylase UbiE